MYELTSANTIYVQFVNANGNWSDDSVTL